MPIDRTSTHWPRGLARKPASNARWGGCLFAAALALSTPLAGAVSFSYSDFSSTTGLTLNGDAAQAGAALRLVPSAGSQAGTAYRTVAVPLTAGTEFSTAFKFLVKTDANSAFGVTDGFTFLLQNDGAGMNALGGAGDGLGYTGLSPSVAVVFRGRGPSFIGVVTGGINPADLASPFNPPGATGFTEGAFYEQNEFAWIDYSAGTLKVFLGTTAVKPGSPVMTAPVDVFGTLGLEAYLGFSAGNGGAFGSQDILTWSFTTAAVPEPESWGLMLSGLLVMGWSLRRRMTDERV